MNRQLITVASMVYAFAGFAAAADETVDRVAEGWKVREAKLKSIRLRWDEVNVETKRVTLPELPNKNADDGLRTRLRTHFLVYDGPSFRLESYEAASEQAGPRTKQLTVYNDKSGLRKVFMPSGAQPLGNISRGSASNVSHYLPLSAVFFTLRPLTSKTIDLAVFSSTNTKARIDERECIVICGRPQGRETLWTIFLDPGRDYAITRWTRSKNNHEFMRCDMSYEAHGGIGFVPKTWTITSVAADDRFRSSVSAKATDCVVGGAIDEKEFDIQFPPGTKVRDFTGEDKKNARSFRVLKDGTEGPANAIVRQSSDVYPYGIGVLGCLMVIIAITTAVRKKPGQKDS